MSSAVPPDDRTSAAPPRGPTRDRRRTHIIDRALDFVALADRGYSAARIARTRRKSAGYVSITLRLGRAIAGMELDELEALRSPRVTWKLAQRIVREGLDAVSVRHQLRAAVGGFSTHNQDGRRNRKGRSRAAAAGADPQRAIGAAWGWDAAWFARDPVGFAESHLRYLGGAHQAVHARALRLASTRAVERVPVGQGIRTLQRSIVAAQASARATARDTPPDGTAAPASASIDSRRALALLEILDRKLAEARAEFAALTATRPAPSRISAPRHDADPGFDAALESELRD